MKYSVKDFSTEEKLRLICGASWWTLETLGGKLAEVVMSDGPLGVRHQEFGEIDESLTAPSQMTAYGPRERYTVNDTTAMPSTAVVASTWNTELSRLAGETIADECVEKKRDIILAPGVNIKRTPLCGRNFEYYSEDPYLAGTMAKAFIEGAQAKGIGTCLKHFCANNSEYDRDHQSSEVDERTLREIYLPAFEIATGAKPWSVMCAYNQINGVYASENSYLLNDVLRGEFGFDGVVISDWYAVRQSARAAKAGLDIEMPYRKRAYGEVKAAYEAGYLTDEDLDTLARRILAFIEKKVEADKRKSVTYTKEERHANAVRIVEEGAVLLKNEGGILPLKDGKIHVTGLGADRPPVGGGGSSKIEPEYKTRHLADELSERLGDAATVTRDRSPLFRYNGKMIAANHALVAGYDADTVVFCIGNDETVEFESGNRSSLDLPMGAEDMLVEMTKYNENIVVVVYAGSAVDMSRWIDKVGAVLFVGFGGEGAQEAVANLLVGKISPSGKLQETLPISLEDTPTGGYQGDGFVDRYDEGIFVGYRYYERFGVDVLYPFGHGLSYAEFEYSNLTTRKLGDFDFELSFTVKNTSAVTAKEVAEIYVRDVFAAVARPVKELRAFEKVELAPGEAKRITVRLGERDFAYYNTSLHRWYVEDGAFEILVGSSSQDIRLKTRVDIETPLYSHQTFVVYDLDGSGAR